MKLSNKWKNKRRILATIGATALAIPPIVAIVSCSKPKPEPVTPIIEPTEEEKHKSPGIDIDEAEYKFVLKNTYDKGSISVFASPAGKENEECEVDASIVSLQGKELICKVKWNKKHIIDTTYLFDLRFISNKDSWTQKIQGLSLEWQTIQKLSDIKYIDGSAKTTYNYGDKLDVSNMEVELTSSDGQKETTKTGITTIPAHGDVLNHENTAIEVIYKQRAGEPLKTHVPLTINPIYLHSSIYPEKSFKVGERITRDDIIAKATYSDGSKRDVKDECSFPEIDGQGFKFTKSGTFAFKAVWTKEPSVNTQFGVLVKEADVVSLDVKLVDPDKKYIIGDKIKQEDFVVTATMTGGDQIILSKNSYTTMPVIPDEGIEITQVSTIPITFTFVNPETTTKVESTFNVEVIMPLIKAIEVTGKHRWYHANFWPVQLSDFDVTAIYSNIPARKINYSTDKKQGFITEPAVNERGNISDRASSINNVHFAYDVGGNEVTFDYPIKSGWNKIEDVQVSVLKSTFNVGDTITDKDLAVYGKFKDIPDPERLFWEQSERYSYGYYTSPAIPYTFKPEDAGRGKSNFHVKTSDELGAKDVNISNQILVENTDIKEIFAYPRSSQQWYVGQSLTRDDIVVDEVYTSGKVAHDIKNWQSEEQFPILLIEKHIPNLTVHISRYDHTCECNIPVWKSKGEKVDVRIDPTYAGTVQGKSFLDVKVETGVAWKEIKDTFTQYTPTPISEKRHFNYWSLSNDFKPINDSYVFNGGEIITARYQDDISLNDCACFTSTGQSKITFNSMSILDNFWYSIDNGETWIKPQNNETVTLPKNSILYLRGDNFGQMRKPIQLTLEGDVHVSGRALALVDGGLLTPTEPEDNVTFEALFKGSTGLKTIEQNFFAGVKTLYQSKFKETFAGCSNLVRCPDLPKADVIPASCYQSTFEGCSSIISVPANWTGRDQGISAKQYCANCFNSAFKGCVSMNAPTNLNFEPNTKFESGCFTSMYENSPGVVACDRNQTDSQNYRTFFKFDGSVQNIDTIAHNICNDAKGSIFTPKPGEQYNYIWSIESGSNPHQKSIVPRGAKYFRKTVMTRRDIWNYEDPSLYASQLNDNDDNNEWHHDDNTNPGYRIRGNHIDDYAHNNNDNYRQINHKLAINFILNPTTTTKLSLEFKFNCWMTSNSSFFGVNTNNDVGATIYRLSNINDWPNKIGDIYVKEWSSRYSTASYLYSDYVHKGLKKWSTYSQTLKYTLTLEFTNDTPYPKVFNLYFLLATAVDGNSFKVNGDKRGSINTYISFDFHD